MDNKINFTKVVIDSLPSPESRKRNIYHDTKTRGLQLRITSVKTFFVNKRIKGGDPERITLGRYPDNDDRTGKTKSFRNHS